MAGQRCLCDRVWTLDKAKDMFKKNGCDLLATVFQGAHTPMDYICSCGSPHRNTLSHFKKGQRCQKCAGNAPPTLEDVTGTFVAAGCVLLSPYKNSVAKLTYQCSCGSTSRISFSKFKVGQRCQNCEEQRKTAIFRDKYGVSNPSKHPMVKAKTIATNISRYGHPNPLMNEVVRAKANTTLFDRYGVTHVSQTLLNYSKESQRLFWLLYKELPNGLREKAYFAELNHEFESQNPFFRYDFVVSSIQRCIEYNGSAWHPLPELDDAAVGWHVGNRSITAGESRRREATKFEQLTRRGFRMLVIWDYEFKSDPELTVSRCLSFLLEAQDF